MAEKEDQREVETHAVVFAATSEGIHNTCVETFHLFYQREARPLLAHLETAPLTRKDKGHFLTDDTFSFTLFSQTDVLTRTRSLDDA